MTATTTEIAAPVVVTDPPPLIERVIGPLIARGWLPDLVLAALTVVVGSALRFTQDDAFITLRYSRNLADGNGLVFNIGERVEGYTNFLWTVWLAVPHQLGVDPVMWSDVTSISAGVVTVLATRRIAMRVIDDERWALIACGLLIAFHSFAIYLTGGLETQWQACFITLAIAGLMKSLEGSPDLRALALASVAGGLACLTRLDSAVLLLGAGVPVMLALRRQGALGARVLVAGALPGAALLVPWLGWKWSYYEALLPNTFVAKQTPILWALGRGLFFLTLFGVVTFLFVALPLSRRGWSAWRRHPPARMLRIIIATWVVYLLWVGGDFMEFRFLVPVMPIGMILLTAAISRLDQRRALTIIGVIVAGSLVKWVFFYPAVLGIESARALGAHVTEPGGWREMGEVLAADFPARENGGPTIAITAAGAVPYYARLRTVDMLGLTDVGANELNNRWELTKLKAGHEHIATIDYLRRSGVDLVLGGLVSEPCGSIRSEDALDVVRRMFLTYPVTLGDVPDDARLVEIPLRSNDRCLFALDLSDGERRARIDATGYQEVSFES